MAKIVWLLAALLCISFDASAAAGGCPREVVSRQSYAGVLEAIRCGAGFCTAEIESDGPHEVFLKPAAKSSLGMIGSGVRVKTVTVRYVSQGVCGAREVLADVSVISDPPYSDDELAPGFDICESAAEGDDGMTACADAAVAYWDRAAERTVKSSGRADLAALYRSFLEYRRRAWQYLDAASGDAGHGEPRTALAAETGAARFSSRGSRKSLEKTGKSGRILPFFNFSPAFSEGRVFWRILCHCQKM